MAHILVLAGGNSDEREVSLRSGSAVANALRTKRHAVTEADSNDIRKLDVSNIEVAFPALHGVGGEDGSIQEALEELNLPYVGSGVAASKLCFDKWQWRETMQGQGVPVADGALVEWRELEGHYLTREPFVLKPYDGGSSIDTFIVRDATKVPWQNIERAFEHHPKMLLEKLVAGIEITVAVLGDTGLPVIEIIPPESGEFDYENKYNGATQELCPAVNVPAGVQAAAQSLAVKVHQLCGCRDMSRTDMIVSGDGSLTVLETNTIPGLTGQSLFPKAAAASGLSKPELCDKLVQAAFSRRTENV
jgi:D-alanine-D-alanine ligase